MKFIINFLLISTIAFAGNKETGLVVQGKSKISESPDMAKLSFTIKKISDDYGQSTSQANSDYEKLISTLKNLKLEKSNFKTTQYRVNPKYEWQKDKRIFKGHETTISFDFTSSDIKKIALALTSAQKESNAQMSGPTFFFSDEKHKDIYLRCLKLATKDAQAKAKLLSKSLGVKLGKVDYINEHGMQYHPPMPIHRPEMMSASASRSVPPMESGEQTLQASITVHYKIK